MPCQTAYSMREDMAMRVMLPWKSWFPFRRREVTDRAYRVVSSNPGCPAPSSEERRRPEFGEVRGGCPGAAVEGFDRRMQEKAPKASIN